MVNELETLETVKQDLDTIETSYTPPSKEEARWVFDYSHLYWEIKARLLGGWITQNKKNEYQIVRPKGANPLLNVSGIEETMALINGFVTKIQGLTVLDEERVLILSKDIYIKLAQLYYINMENFDIDPARASIIVRMIMNLFESNLRKSLQGRSLLLIGQTERIVETRTEPTRKKILGII